jgi:2-oxo-3-hexenedioate decarboxylase
MRISCPLPGCTGYAPEFADTGMHAIDGEVIHRATGSAILGHPLRAVQVLAAHLERRGETLPAGSVVLAGALTDAVPVVRERSYRLSVDGLGAVTVRT